MIWLARSFATWLLNFGISLGILVSMVVQAGLWAIGSLIDLVKLGKLRLAMYGKNSSGGGACSILALWGKCGAFGGGWPTKNEDANDAPNNEVVQDTFLLRFSGGIRRGSIPMMGGRPCSHRDNLVGGELAIVVLTLYQRFVRDNAMYIECFFKKNDKCKNMQYRCKECMLFFLFFYCDICWNKKDQWDAQSVSAKILWCGNLS